MPTGPELAQLFAAVRYEAKPIKADLADAITEAVVIYKRTHMNHTLRCHIISEDTTFYFVSEILN